MKNLPRVGQKVTVICTDEKAICIGHIDICYKIAEVEVIETGEIRMYHIKDLK